MGMEDCDKVGGCRSKADRRVRGQIMIASRAIQKGYRKETLAKNE